uniref:Apoptosis inhibitor n=1 Tax=Spodoptera littoralis nuclear polyhedrosis virus TaxID=10456 RepID=A0A3G4S948_NPVSL|nr:apoptosis inhibitor [Spodoptera littoralis nucleopolyhedrovirus]
MKNILEKDLKPPNPNRFRKDSDECSIGTRCVGCKIEFFGYDKSEIRIEHARWSPNCLIFGIESSLSSSSTQSSLPAAAAADDDDAALCKVCFERNRTVCFEPCHHVTVCEKCADKIDICCVCRADIVKMFKVYL